MPIWDINLNVLKPIREYPKTDDVSFGAALKRERLNRGWTQEQTAKHLNLLHPNYLRLEKNIHLPHIKKRKQLNTFLGYNFWDDGTNKLSNRLLLYRIENELSASEFGVLIDVSRNTIKRIELNIKTSSKMKKIIEAFISLQTTYQEVV